jgi:hypothetical protein
MRDGRWWNWKTCLWLVVGLHVLALAVTWPDIPLIEDEAHYIDAAMAFSHGSIDTVARDFSTLRHVPRQPSMYPVGTSLLQSPFVFLFGWRGAYVPSIVGFFATTAAVAWILRMQRLPPIFALVTVLFLPSLVLSRVAVSDCITTGLVATSLACFMYATQAAGRAMWLAGLLAGLAFSCREMSAVFFFPLFIGSAVRRDPKVWSLYAGVAIGVLVRLGGSYVAFGSPFFRHSGYGTFALEHFLVNWPFYALLLTFGLPLGTWVFATYRGWRWPEVLASVAAFALLYAFYEYGASESGGAVSLVIGGRYLATLLPLYVLALTWWWQRRVVEATVVPGWQPYALRLYAPILVGLAVLSCAIHPAMWAWTRQHRRVADTLCSAIPADARVLVDMSTLGKFTRHFVCDRAFAGLESSKLHDPAIQDGRALYVAVGPREDSSVRRTHANKVMALLEATFGERLQVVASVPTDFLGLLVWKVRDPATLPRR